MLDTVPTEADPDVWIRPAKKKNRMEYYEMPFALLDGILALSEDAKGVIESVGEFYTVKPGSDKTPELYLGANVENTQTPDGKESPTSSSGSCVKNVIKTAEDLLVEDEEGRFLGKKVKNTFRTSTSRSSMFQMSLVMRYDPDNYS